MNWRVLPSWRVAVPLTVAALLPAFAQVPGEVTRVTIDKTSTLRWDTTPTATDYNVYRGLVDQLRAGVPLRCHANELIGISFVSAANPAPGTAYAYLVTAENGSGEGTPGTERSGAPRALLGKCDDVDRLQILNRLTYGRNEYVDGRLSTLGISGFINEQLAPETIDESSNTDLNDKLAPITPPETVTELNAQLIVRGTYARRQLEQLVTAFWFNHFNTNYSDITPFFPTSLFDATTRARLTVELQYGVTEQLRQIAFNGTFRELLEASAKSPAMILYLDTDENVVGKPNENYARELLELHSLGVDGGYTQQDIQELARALTGWNVCKKTDAVKDDPLAACIARSLEPTTAGTYVANFRTNQHDHGQKILFAGTPQQVTIPSTQTNQAQGVNDLEIALDAITNHPSTRRFIAKKLLELLIQEQPTAGQIDTVVQSWLANSGVLRELLRTVVTLADLRAPDQFHQKVRTPMEQFLAALRATRGKTNGSSVVRGYLQRAAHLIYQNPVPTGFAEAGADWLDTNNTLERQNYAMDLCGKTGVNFGTDLIGLMNANGLNTSSTPAAIIDFWIGQLYGGALTPGDRQEAINFLSTNDNGLPDAALTNARIRDAVGFLIGLANYQEQ